MSAHTPGPWSHVYGAIMANGEMICEIPNPHWPNARLIAASPDLLEALKELVDLNVARNMNKAKAAIAKAEGGAK